jgi:hypothetical protein
MDEQRILDGIERRLADDDPRLASRLAAFGQPRISALLGSRRTRAFVILVSLALAAIITVMVYSMRPPGSLGRPAQPTHRPSVVATPGSQQGGSPAASRSAVPKS